jgi:hypothetical protein
MKVKALAVAVMLFVSVPAFANEGQCKRFAEFMASIARAHQDGVPLRKIVETGKSSGWNKELMAEVIKVYKKPRFTTDEYQAKAVTEVEDDALIRCYQAVGG